MYIHPFICGVIFTIAAEVLATIIFLCVAEKREAEKENNNK